MFRGVLARIAMTGRLSGCSIVSRIAEQKRRKGMKIGGGTSLYLGTGQNIVPRLRMLGGMMAGKESDACVTQPDFGLLNPSLKYLVLKYLQSLIWPGFEQKMCLNRK